MNSTLLTGTTPGTLAGEPIARPALVPIKPLRFSTLTAVEMRKMTDTRSGRGVLGGIVGLAAIALGWKLTKSDIEVSFGNYGGTVSTVVAFFAPILGLLAMTSEWTQRTALTTFTLAPRRLHVMGAKFVSVIVLTLGLLAAGLLLTLATTAAGGLIHGGATYDGVFTDIRSYTIFAILQVTMAAAMGAVIAQSAAALVTYLVAPTAFAILSEELLKGASPWFDIFQAYENLSDSKPFDHFAQSLTAIAIWVVIPSILGIIGTLRREVK